MTDLLAGFFTAVLQLLLLLTVAPLVSGDFRINPGVMAETGMGSPQHLKIPPLKPDGFKPGLHMPVPDVIPPHRLGAVLRREQPRIRFHSTTLHPLPQVGDESRKTVTAV